MAQRQRRVATLKDLERVPDNMVGEILDGELVASPRPGVPHGHAAIMISSGLVSWFYAQGGGPRSGWWFLPEPELHLDGDVVVPDLAGWRRERMAALPSTAAIELPPDWVCEVISPRTAAYDRVQKQKIFARERIPFVWHVDPLARTLEVFRLTGDRYLVLDAHRDDQRARAEPFEAIELDLARWWLPGPDPDVTDPPTS